MDTSSQQQIDDKIADSLGLEPLNNNQKQLPVSIEHTVEADFDYARGKIGRAHV